MGKSIQLPGGVTFDVDAFKGMTYEEKFSLIKKAFGKVREDPTMKGVLFNPNTKARINLEDIVDTPQEVSIIDAIIKSIEDESIMSSVVKSNEVQETLERIKNGDATEEEKAIEDILEQDCYETREGSMVVQNVANMVVQIAQFTEHKRNYRSKVADYVIPLMSVFSLQAIFTEGTVMSKYLQNPDASNQVVEMLGQEIMDNWKKTASSMPDNLTLAIALMTQIIELTKGIPVGPVDELARLIGEATGAKMDIEVVDGPPPENGSNTVQPQIYTGEDAEMRDILRD